MSKYCRICRNTECTNHGKDIIFAENDFICDYRPQPSNADHIRAMSDNELAEIIMCPYGIDEDSCNKKSDCLYCLTEWLQQPYESPTGQKG